MPDSGSGLIERLRAHPKLGREIVHAAFLPAVAAKFAELDPPLPQPIARALAAGGVERLWAHQAEGLAAARRGEDVLITTPTASGKSLVFQLPVLEESARGGPGRALFLFPLKALGQDQKGKFDVLARAAGLDEAAAGCQIYDGDTPQSKRAAIKRDFPRVVVSNPDMLHLGILGAWTGWAPFLRDLKWIVVDELHTYRGIFGSHFYHVLQRFLRLCRAEGANPSLVASSATAANAAEFAAALTGRDFRWIGDSGAPREGRHLVLLNPAGSPYTTALALFVTLVSAGLKTIVFTKARRITELLFSWLRRQDPALARRVASYRAGFLAEERRRIERDLFSGRLDGVISTSALEMGIDVGGLDACILVGYPGSVMSTWQRSGRVGRAGRESVTALVAMPDALDQYFLGHPEELLGRPCERLVVDPGNQPVARGHLICAAAERPLAPARDRPYLDRHAPVVEELLAGAELLRTDGGEICSLRRRPQRHINLRGTGATYQIVSVRRGRGAPPPAGDVSFRDSEPRGRVIGTVDAVRALYECHPGAIYLHAGRQYLVDELDGEERRALVHREDVDYFTTPLTEKETEILEVLGERREGPLAAWLGRVKVTQRVVGFERRRIHGQETIDQLPLDLPPTHFETVALWWAAPAAFEEALRRRGEHFMGALHAAEHAAISLFPLLAICDRGDIGGISYPFHPQVGCGAVFVYDGHPGGVGIARRGFDDLPELLARVEDLLVRCECDDGCPSCIQSPKCGNGNRPLDKAGAARVVRLLLGREEAGEERIEPVVLRLEAPVEPRSRRRPVVAPVEQPPPAAEAAGLRPGHRGHDEPPFGRDGARTLQPLSPAVAIERGASSEGSPAGAIERGADRLESVAGPPGPTAALPSARAEARAALLPGDAGVDLEAPAISPFRLWLRTTVGRWFRPRQPAFGTAAAGGDGRLGTVLLDLETRRSAAEVGGWGNAHRMGIAIAVVCHLEEGRFEVFGEDEVPRLADTLARASLVVGFNVKRFDYRVLAGYTGVDYARSLPTLDLLEEIHRTVGFRVGLDALARATLGAGKTADGLQSLRWVAEGRLDLVADYCRHDVEVLRDLYLYGRREGHVFFPHRRSGSRLRLPVDW